MNFKDLINNNRQNVRNIIKLITKESNEDLEQEVFIKIWKNRAKYLEQGHLKNWINTVAKNLAKDYLKLARKKYECDNFEAEINSIQDPKVTPELKLQTKIRQQKIIKAIESLKPKLKQVIILCDIEGNTYEQAAEILRVPIGTIKSRIFNAKKELALMLKDLV